MLAIRFKDPENQLNECVITEFLLWYGLQSLPKSILSRIVWGLMARHVYSFLCVYNIFDDLKAGINDIWKFLSVDKNFQMSLIFFLIDFWWSLMQKDVIQGLISECCNGLMKKERWSFAAGLCNRIVFLFLRDASTSFRRVQWTAYLEETFCVVSASPCCSGFSLGRSTHTDFSIENDCVLNFLHCRCSCLFQRGHKL